MLCVRRAEIRTSRFGYKTGRQQMAVCDPHTRSPAHAADLGQRPSRRAIPRQRDQQSPIRLRWEDQFNLSTRSMKCARNPRENQRALPAEGAKTGIFAPWWSAFLLLKTTEDVRKFAAEARGIAEGGSDQKGLEQKRQRRFTKNWRRAFTENIQSRVQPLRYVEAFGAVVDCDLATLAPSLIATLLRLKLAR